MKITLSSVKHIPIITQWEEEYYPWQLHHLIAKSLKLHVRLRRARSLGMEFTPARAVIIREEWDLWDRCYKPTLKRDRGLMILDAGSGEGETLLFYYLLGVRQFRLVEADRTAYVVLKKSAEAISDAHCELLNRNFQAHDLLGIDFAKIDIEGGEAELLKATLESLPKEMVVETHDRSIREQLQFHLGPSWTFLHQLSRNPEVILWRWIKPASGREKRANATVLRLRHHPDDR